MMLALNLDFCELDTGFYFTTIDGALALEESLEYAATL